MMQGFFVATGHPSRWYKWKPTRGRAWKWNRVQQATWTWCLCCGSELQTHWVTCPVCGLDPTEAPHPDSLLLLTEHQLLQIARRRISDVHREAISRRCLEEPAMVRRWQSWRLAPRKRGGLTVTVRALVPRCPCGRPLVDGRCLECTISSE